MCISYMDFIINTAYEYVAKYFEEGALKEMTLFYL